MKGKISSLFILMGLLLFTSCKQVSRSANTDKTTEQERMISLNGALTEIVYDLNKGKELVGRDVTSTYPEWVKDSVTDLGHVRSIGVEPVLALHPDKILAVEGDLSDDLVNALKESSVELHLFKQEYSVEGAKKLVDQVGEVIGNTDTKSIHQKIDDDLNEVKAFETKPKVLFVYARGAGTLMIAGENTPMNGIINLAGAQNAVQGIDGFKPLTEEALLAANPDAVLLFETGLESLGGKKGMIKSIPALSQTNAGKKEAIITMEGGILSEFGPRVGEAAKKLNTLLASYAD